MWKKIRGKLIVAAALLILALGGCEGFTKTDYAADAAFVKNSGGERLFVAL